ncbi:MAG: hypothetical protein NTY14_02590 [Candidatus Omnitrophica bacterium]|nr:hypothetical protein [Candidatus Omnitrophota bacterium]
MDINSINQAAEAEIKDCESALALEELKVKYLGRKGILAGLTGSIPTLPVVERGAFGKQVNELKNRLTGLFNDKESQLKTAGPQEKTPRIDISLPGVCQELGRNR